MEMIRKCLDGEFETIYEIINDSAQAYKGIIPMDCWKDPYMSKGELQREINEGVGFWGYEKEGELVGVMGIQHVQNVILIRHAYILTVRQNQGIGGKLLSCLLTQTDRPFLVGTWADATWAIRFYKKYGFEFVTTKEKDRLLKKYWSVPDRQIRSSVVLVDKRRSLSPTL
jgi:N-acetylglutamate synthase-like GNAT family acetyltransferase